MFATLTGAGIACSAMYAAMNWKDTDKKKISRIFRNTGYRIKDREARLVREDKKERWTDYIYSVPAGLVDDPKLQPVLEKTLGRPVKVMFQGKLIVRVYHEQLPKMITYDWQRTDGWTVPIGQTQEGMLYHDFDKVPHMTVAGATRQGKTVLLKLIMAHLINSHPDDLQLYVIDLKGGLEFVPYSKYRQVKSVASNVNEALNLLRWLQGQMQADMDLFRRKEYTNILDTPINIRRFLIIDEGAELAAGSHHLKEEKAIFRECQHILSELCRIGGALGYRNIFCTQYPTADTLPRQVKQNSDAKISFRLPTEVASRVAIDEQGAEKLTRPGMAIYRTHEKHIMQVPYVSNRDIKEKLKGEIRHDDSPAAEESAERRKDIVTLGGIELCNTAAAAGDHGSGRG